MADTTEVHAIVVDGSGALKGGQDVGKAAVEVEKAARKVQDATAKQEKYLDSLTRRYDPAAAAAAKYAKEVARIEGIMAGGGANSERAAQVLALVHENYKRLGDGADNASGKTSRFGSAMQQAGYQIADVANQVGAGGNAFVAVGMQLGQFLGAFGTVGAVAGAVISIMGPLAAKFLEVGEATKDAEKAERAYADALSAANELTKTSIDLQRQKAEASRASAAASVAEQRAQAQKDFLEAGKERAALLKQIEAQEKKYGEGNYDLVLSRQLEAVNKQYDGAFDRLTKLEQAARDLDKPAVGSSLWEQNNADRISVTEEIGAQMEAREKAAADAVEDGEKRKQDALKLTAAAEEAAWDHRKAFLDEEQRAYEKRQEGRADIGEYLSNLERETALLAVSATERERVNATLQAENIAKQAGIELGDEERARIDAAYEARERVTEAMKRQSQAEQQLETFGERAFDRIGSAMTQMAMQGNNAFMSLRNIGTAVISEMMQEFVKLAAINPLKNAIFGGSAQTMSGLLSGLFGDSSYGGYGAYGGVSDSISASSGSFSSATTMNVPMAFAGGTDYAPSGVALVGEEGPELVQLGGGERIYTADQTSRLMGGAANGNLSIAEGAIVVNAPGATAEDAQAIALAVAQQVVAAAAPQIQRGAVQQSVGAVQSLANRGGSFAQSVGRR